MTEGGSPLWIGNYNYGQTNIFVNDGSYVTASPNTPGAKVRYLNDDHSAIAETSDIFISKWSYYPLYRHHKNHSPFGSSSPQVAYYKRASAISGPDNPLYNTNTVYNISSPSSATGTSVNWSVTPSGSATVSGNGNSATIKFLVSGVNCTVQATTSLPGGAITTPISKTVSLKPRHVVLDYVSTLYVSNTITFTVVNYHPDATYEWDPIQGEVLYATDDHMYMGCPNEPFDGDQAYANYVIVRCRSLIGGAYSDWTPYHYVRLKYLE